MLSLKALRPWSATKKTKLEQRLQPSTCPPSNVILPCKMVILLSSSSSSSWWRYMFVVYLPASSERHKMESMQHVKGVYFTLHSPWTGKCQSDRDVFLLSLFNNQANNPNMVHKMMKPNAIAVGPKTDIKLSTEPPLHRHHCMDQVNHHDMKKARICVPLFGSLGKQTESRTKNHRLLFHWHCVHVEV